MKTNLNISYLVIAAVILLLCLHPMIASTYFISVGGTAVAFLGTFLLLIIIYTAVAFVTDRNHPTKTNFAVMFMLFTLCLQMATAVTLPLLHYTCGLKSDKVIGMSAEALKYAILFVVAFVIASVGMKIVPDVFRQNPRLFPMCAGISAVVNFIIAALLIFGGDNGSTFVLGVQIGVPLLAYLIVMFVAYYHMSCNRTSFIYEKNNKRRRILAVACWGSLVTILLGYAVCNEFGVLLFFLAAALIWFIFYLADKSMKMIGCVLASSAAAVAAAGGVYWYYTNTIIPMMETSEELGKLMNYIRVIGEKIDRITNPGAYNQTTTALRQIQNAGFFGKTEYVYVPAASSDFSIATHTHYIGYIWLMVLIFLLTLAVIAGNIYFKQRQSSKTEEFPHLECLAFLVIMIISLYNISANLGLIGVIGVNCYASGLGTAHHLLSGCLLGFVLNPLQKRKLDQK